jgi:hypothetical protein
MIRILIVALLTLTVSSASFARKLVAEGKSYTPLGGYKIELADNQVNLKGHDCTSYVISYENTPMEVKVIICKDRNCKRYVVLSDKLSVQYVCNKDYFGVEKLGKEFEAEGFKTSDSELNRLEYFHQKVLCPGQGNELDNTKLIAAFFPMLLNDQANIIAQK